jgi:hypothetical protein
MRLMRYVSLVGETRNEYKILVGKPVGRENSEDVGEDRNIILEWILGKQCGKL